MIGEWAYIKSYFTPEQCDRIIQEALILPEQEAKLGPSSDRVNNEWRRSSIRGIVRNSTWSYLFTELDKVVDQINNEWFQVDYKFLPAIQFATYTGEEQSFYKRHQDVFLAPLPTQRKLSVTVQLSNPDTYKGGDLKFLDVGHYPNSENLRARGTVCVFPSIIFHEVTPLISGVRHSLAGWYEGPHWR
jgi:PKHD-type hydroxylase